MIQKTLKIRMGTELRIIRILKVMAMEFLILKNLVGRILIQMMTELLMI